MAFLYLQKHRMPYDMVAKLMGAVKAFVKEESADVRMAEKLCSSFLVCMLGQSWDT